MYEEFFPFIYLAFGLTFAGFVIQKFSSTLKDKFKTQKVVKARGADSRQIDDQLSNFIDNAPRIVLEINAEIENQKKAGVSDEQMKGLLQKKNMLEFVVQNKEIIDIIGKPILKKVVGFIKAI